MRGDYYRDHPILCEDGAPIIRIPALSVPRPPMPLSEWPRRLGYGRQWLPGGARMLEMEPDERDGVTHGSKKR